MIDLFLKFDISHFEFLLLLGNFDFMFFFFNSAVSGSFVVFLSFDVVVHVVSGGILRQVHNKCQNALNYVCLVIMAIGKKK